MIRLLTTVVALAMPVLASAQIATDGTLGLPAVDLVGPDPGIEIPSGVGKLSGDSLFFSFAEFNVPEGRSVTFVKDSGVGSIDTVVSRVTGGSPSRIDGEFRSELGEQDFYFLNPWGIFFGPGSSIDVGGSFHVTTADELRDSATRFSARTPSDAILAGRPEAFGFLSTPDRGDIEIRGEMIVERGATIDLVGGDVRTRGGTAAVWAPSGLVRIAALDSAGEVVDPGDGSGLQVAATGALGAVEILEESYVSASGVDETDLLDLVGTGNDLWGPLERSGLFLIIPGGEVREGDVEIGANADRSYVGILRSPISGSIFVRGDSLRIEDSDLRSTSYGPRAGAIEIDLDGRLEIRKNESIFDVGVLGRSESRTITHPVGFYGGPLLPLGSAPITIDFSTSSHVVAATGPGTDITIHAGEIGLFDGARISATTIAPGRGGNVLVQADRAILISGVDELAEPTEEDGNEPRQPPTAIFSNSQGTGNAGSIRVETTRLRLEDGGGIIAQTTGNGNAGRIEVDVDRLEITGTSQIDGSTSATSLEDHEVGPTSGEGGDIDIVARDSILLSGGISDRQFARISTFSQEKSAGRAGSIRVATRRLDIEDGAGISVTTRGQGEGGDITIETRDLALHSGGSISARSNSNAVAGDILIQAARVATVDGGASITASTLNGQGGNIAIEARDALVLRDESSVIARAADVEGSGGRVRVSTPVFIRSADSDLSAASPGREALQGEVFIESPEVNIESRVTPAQAIFQDPATLIRPSCAARAERGLGGTFQVEARADRGPDPDAYLRTPGSPTSRPDALAGLRELANAGRTAIKSGESEHAAALLADARRQSLTPKASREQAEIALHVATSYARLAARATTLDDASLLAAFELFSEARTTARKLADDRLLAHALLGLARLYDAEHRTDEALILTREAILAAERVQAPEPLYRSHWLEGRLLWGRGESSDALAAFQRAVSTIEEIRPEARSSSRDGDRRFRDDVAPVYLDLVNALLVGSGRVPSKEARTRMLSVARTTMERFRASELRDYFRDDCAAEVQARTVSLESVAGRAAVVYPIPFPDRLELLVSLPTGIERFSVPVSSVEVEAKARSLQQLLQDRTQRGYMRPATLLYDWLVRPYEDRLSEERIDTLVFVPDGALRLVPMGALSDGKGFLVSRYAVAVSPGLDLVAPNQLEPARARLLLAGVSQAVQGFPALPGVEMEAEAIRALFQGDVLLDEDFVTDRFESALAEEIPSMVHIASHAVFSGDPATSFVLTHDGKLTMDDIAQAVLPTQFRKRPIDLLTFSACETAAGDERAALGLAGVAIRSGARSALGSLWQVNDEATYALIVEFYEGLRLNGVGKAEALRRSQRALIGNPTFAHPYFWAGFLLINDWS